MIPPSLPLAPPALLAEPQRPVRPGRLQVQLRRLIHASLLHHRRLPPRRDGGVLSPRSLPAPARRRLQVGPHPGAHSFGSACPAAGAAALLLLPTSLLSLYGTPSDASLQDSRPHHLPGPPSCARGQQPTPAVLCVAGGAGAAATTVPAAPQALWRSETWRPRPVSCCGWCSGSRALGSASLSPSCVAAGENTCLRGLVL